jgi:hypothetical protein
MARPYKLKAGFGSSFLPARTSAANDEFALEDLKRSWLTPDDMLIETSTDVPVIDNAKAGYVIPYFDLDGKPILGKDGALAMYRCRFKVEALSKIPRYMQPSADKLSAAGLPSYVPYLLPYDAAYDNGTIYCVEGEKKTASVIKNCKVAAFGISGCRMWGNPSGEGGVHPWILAYCRKHGATKVVIIPDGDVLRYDMSQCYGTFAFALRKAGFDVTLLQPSTKIDDAIASRQGEVSGLLESIPKVETLVQSPAALAEEYSLSFTRNAKGRVNVEQNSSTVLKLLENHPAFPKIWKNLDTGKIMLGDDEAVPDVTELRIANHMQYYFGLPRISAKMVVAGMLALAKEQARSPLLDRITGLQWDETQRLETWMIRHWGVVDTPHNRELSKKWLVSACARMDKPGTKVDWMLITIGPGGVGKTTMPSVFFGGNYKVIYGERDEKDMQMVFASSACVGFDELDSFGKKESSHLKAMITQQVDTYRPPYGASVEDYPRRAILYGSGNRENFLQTDAAGYRRYGIVRVPRMLDFKALEKEVDQLWAEAWNVYQNDKELKWYEVDTTTNDAEEFTTPDPLEEQVFGALQTMARQKYGSGGGTLDFDTATILTTMGMVGSRNLSRDIADYLRKFGARSVTKRYGTVVRRVWVYDAPSASAA